MAVDILPSELPLEASQHFSNSILPYLRTIIQEYSSSSTFTTSRLDPELQLALNRATTAFNGELTEKHTWLYDQLKESEKDSGRKETGAMVAGASKKKRVLLLGSGLVSRPFVDQICTRDDVECIVGKDSNPDVSGWYSHQSKRAT